MSLRPGWYPPPVHMNIISGRGGLGDTIARLPAFRYMHDTYEHVSATIYVQDGFYDLVQFLLPSTPRRSYRKLSEASWALKKPVIEFDMERLTTLHKHLTEHAFDILMDMSPPSHEVMAYPSAPFVLLDDMPPGYKLKQKTFVVFTTDHTAPAREWLPVHINTLAKKIREAGLTPVLLGRTEPIPTGVEDDPIIPRQAELNADLFVDLRNKTTLIQALGIMQRAKAVVGIDNGLLHLAHCTDVPVVMGFTTLKPEHRVPVRLGPETFTLPRAPDTTPVWRMRRAARRTKVLEAQVPCAGCQSRGFAINTDWRECVMPENRYACLLTLTADRFYESLKQLGVVT